MHTRAQREAMKAEGRALSPQREYRSPIKKRAPRSRALSPLDLAPVSTSPLSQINSGKIVKKSSAPLTQAKKTRTFMDSLSGMAGGLSNAAKLTFNFFGKTVASTPSTQPPPNEDAPSVSAPEEPVTVASDDMELDHIYDRVQKIDADHHRRFKRAPSFPSTPQKSRYPRPPLQAPDLTPIPEVSESPPSKPVQKETLTTSTAPANPAEHDRDANPTSPFAPHASSILLSVTSPVEGEQQTPRKFLVPQHVHDQVIAIVKSFEVTGSDPKRVQRPKAPRTPDSSQREDTVTIVKRNIAWRKNRSPPPLGSQTPDLLGNFFRRLGVDPEVVDALSKTKDYQELEADWASDSKTSAE